MLIRTLRGALRSGEPLDFLLAVGGFMEAADQRHRSPFQREAGLPDLGTLVDSFIGTPFAETTAALHVIRAFTTDDLLARRIGVELAERRHPLPEWLTRIDDAKAKAEVWFMTHVLGDGDDYFVGVELVGGAELSALIYVDHNMGTVVKDAFAIPSSLQDLLPTIRRTMEDPDQTLDPVDPASSRAQIEQAIRIGALMYPPLESDTWPMCRPVVEWMVRLLPEGGTVPERREWTDRQRAAIADAFVASPFGQGFGTDIDADLLDSLLWFGTDYGPGDPYRWSPVSVEIVLVDWFPRKVVAPAAHLARLPDLLRAFVRFCHAERGIRAAHTRDTLASIGMWEPEYQRLIRSDRPQGAQALLAGLPLPGARGWDDVGDDHVLPMLMLESLDRAVGGRRQLMALGTDPLPDEDFEWAGIPDDIRPVVAEVLGHCDRVADELLDVETRTAMRRLLSRAAVGDPKVFRRKAATHRGAAAIAWIVCSANNTTHRSLYGAGLTSADLLAAFGVTGSVSDRAGTFLQAIGLDRYRSSYSMDLGAPDLLTSACRSELVSRRDRYLAMLAEAED